MTVSRLKSCGAAAAALLVIMTISGCSIVKKVDTAAHDITNNKDKIDTFTSKVQSGESVPFEATYVTSGSAPAKVVYAVDPPHGLMFSDTPTGAQASTGRFDVIVNSSGYYSCTPPSGGSPWTCEKLGTANSTSENQLFDFYTPSHWVTFLRDASIAAGFAGDKVSNSTLTVNGFNMSCVDLVASGVPGTSKICSTSQGILGYVKVASDSTSFSITNYSASPAASLFQLPPGAKVTVPPTTTTTTG